MSISINCNGPTSNQDKITLNHLPCKVDCDGDANTLPMYFKPKGHDKSYTVVFRGTLLEGKTVKMPDAYTGLVLNEKNKPFGEDEARTFNVLGRFDDFTQWYVESQHSSKSTMDLACQTWLNHLSPAIHDPI